MKLSLESETVTGVNSVAGWPASMPGRNMLSQSASWSGGITPAISSASASAGDRKSCPDGSQPAG